MKIILIFLACFISISLPVHAQKTPSQKEQIAQAKNRDIIVERNGKITNYSIKGNLEASNNVGCVDISSLSNMEIPPNIYLGVKECILNDDFATGVELYLLGRVFGLYDGKRIADRTAAQGIIVLQMNTFSGIPKEKLVAFDNYRKEHYSNGSETMVNFCQKIKKIGAPCRT